MKREFKISKLIKVLSFALVFLSIASWAMDSDYLYKIRKITEEESDLPKLQKLNDLRSVIAEISCDIGNSELWSYEEPGADDVKCFQKMKERCNRDSNGKGCAGLKLLRKQYTRDTFGK